jgi:ribosome biogenesis GTPase
MTPLTSWGWNDEWAACLAQLDVSGDGEVGRVVGQERDRWSIQTRLGPGVARVRSTTRLNLYPVVGDWILVEAGPMPSDPWSIVTVFPRRSRFSRGAALHGEFEQVLAANVDTVWIVNGLDAPVNLRRIERYLALSWESGASPEIVLTKSDLAEELDATFGEVQAIASGVPIRVVSTLDPASVTNLRRGLEPGRTVALLGPSGVGKSTLVNLLAETTLAETGEVRDSDRKGRHTTTRRELFQIFDGALLLDTPGLRELRVWELSDGLQQAFPEIDDLAQRCRFRDCRHAVEPGCAVLEAVNAGSLDAGRLESFRKLLAEAAFQARKSDHRLQAAAVAEHKAALKSLKHHPKLNDQDGRPSRWRG